MDTELSWCPIQTSSEHLLVVTPITQLLKVAVSKDYIGSSLHRQIKSLLSVAH